MPFHKPTKRNRIVPSLLALGLATGLATGLSACGKKTNTAEKKVTQTVQAKPAVLGSFGLELANMDKSVKPGDDFFQFMNGTWLKNTEIPADKSNYGSFNILGDRSEAQVKAIIQDMAATKAAPGSDEQKIGELYATFMDTDTIEKNGLTPIQADLAAIRAVADHSAAAAMMGNPAFGLLAPVGGWVDVDVKETDKYIFYITQSGLGMPNKTYYLDEGDKFHDYRIAYVAFMAKMLEAAGRNKKAWLYAEAVMDFETQLAEVHWDPAKRRERDLTYNKMDIDALVNYAPGFDWRTMMNASGLGAEKTIIVRENDALQASAKIFGETDMDIIRDYMTIHYTSSNAAYLPKDIDDARFEFYSKTLRGTEVQRDRWKRGVGQVSGVLGEAIGKVYVERHFPPAAKAQMDELVENLRATFKESIEKSDWMGEATKVEAKDKLKKFYAKIGYPKIWTNYSDLKIDKNDLIGSIKSANTWQWNDMISDLGGPIDREEWGMTPQTVNAYYRPSLNEIVFPAAILQAPFFDPNADAAVNYGGIGAVIGHEMGHGFDDQGAKSDGDGRQRNWWSPEDEAAFKAKSQALVAQYNAFSPLPDQHVNGQLTLGENIGDLTGITMAYAAYKRSLGGEEAPEINGLTGDQRFFLSYSQIWQRKFRDDALLARLKTDPHSPGQYRANGIVRNFDPWYEAFDVQPGDALYLAPEDRVKIW